MAHAWPEVYLEDIGWIPFEPTPGYSQTRYASWEVKNSSTELSDDLNNHMQETEWTGDRIPNKSKQEMGDIQESVIYSEKNNIGRLLLITGRILLSILGSALLLLLLSLLLARYKYQKMSTEIKFKTEVSRNLKILSFMGIRRKDAQTLSEFKEQAQLFIGEQEPLQFLNCYEDFLYGDKKITQHTLAEVQRQQLRLLLILKQRKRRTYFYYRILMSISHISSENRQLS